MFNVLLAIIMFSVAIIIVAFMSNQFKDKESIKEQLRELRKASDDNNVAELELEIEIEITRLRDRIEVLEKIVTDSKYDLDQKISKL